MSSYLILAGGNGSRMNLNGKTPKCLLNFAQQTILTKIANQIILGDREAKIIVSTRPEFAQVIQDEIDKDFLVRNKIVIFENNDHKESILKAFLSALKAYPEVKTLALGDIVFQKNPFLKTIPSFSQGNLLITGPMIDHYENLDGVVAINNDSNLRVYKKINIDSIRNCRIYPWSGLYKFDRSLVYDLEEFLSLPHDQLDISLDIFIDFRITNKSSKHEILSGYKFMNLNTPTDLESCRRIYA